MKDGSVLVTRTAFKSPAALAWALYHELMHYNLLLGEREYGMTRPAEEVWLIKIALSRAEVLGIGQDDFRTQFQTAAGLDWISREWNSRISRGKNPQDNPELFEMSIPEDVLAGIQRDIEGDLQRFSAASGDTPSVTELEALKAGSASNFVKNLSNGDLSILMQAWKRARQTDRDAQRRESEIQSLRIEAEANACGFVVTPEGFFYSGVTLHFRTMHEGNVDRARAAFLLIDACAWQGRPERGPCNDAIGIVAVGWADRRFRDALMKMRTTDPFLDGESEVGQCLLDLRAGWTPRGTFADLKGVIEKNYAHRQTAGARPRQPAQPQEPREPRDPPPPPRGDRGCYWTNDGREICP